MDRTDLLTSLAEVCKRLSRVNSVLNETSFSFGSVPDSLKASQPKPTVDIPSALSTLDEIFVELNYLEQYANSLQSLIGTAKGKIPDSVATAISGPPLKWNGDFPSQQGTVFLNRR